MKLSIEVDMDGAAFDDETELAYVLTKLAVQVTEHGASHGRVRDTNGNNTASWEVSEG